MLVQKLLTFVIKVLVVIIYLQCQDQNKDTYIGLNIHSNILVRQYYAVWLFSSPLFDKSRSSQFNAPGKDLKNLHANIFLGAEQLPMRDTAWNV